MADDLTSSADNVAATEEIPANPLDVSVPTSTCEAI